MTNAIDARRLDECLAALEGVRAWSPRVVSRLESFIRCAPDLELFRLNAMKYAAAQGTEPREALDLLLHATKAGLFEMDWHIVCPHCGYVVDSLHTMSQLRTHYVCPICGAEQEHSLDDYVIVGFTVAPSVRRICYHDPESLEIEDLYFNRRLSRDVISPLDRFDSWRDVIVHITKYLRYVEPGEQVRAEIDLPPGNLRATNGTGCAHFAVRHDSSPSPSHISVQIAEGRFRSNDPELGPGTRSEVGMAGEAVPLTFDLTGTLPSGRLVLELENREERRTPLCVYHSGELPPPVLGLEPCVTGGKLLTTQTFRDLFRSEVVRTDETLSMRDITFVFTDLKGSTAMYERVGDAKAYYLVRQHFDALGHVVRERNGSVVKTIGDAVMAVFSDPVDATQAALEMLSAVESLNGQISEELVLKVGIHRGHSMVVTVDGRVDYFGQSVNIAARVQALADANEVYLTADVRRSPGVVDVLEAREIPVGEVFVKGVSERLQVYRVGSRA